MSKDIKNLMTKALAKAVAYTLGFGVMLFVWPLIGITAVQVPNDTPAPAHPSEALIAAHDCWTGKAPEDVKMPGHAVIGKGDHVWYAGPVGVNKALEHVFNDQYPNLTVYAFCR